MSSSQRQPLIPRSGPDIPAIVDQRDDLLSQWNRVDSNVEQKLYVLISFLFRNIMVFLPFLNLTLRSTTIVRKPYDVWMLP